MLSKEEIKEELRPSGYLGILEGKEVYVLEWMTDDDVDVNVILNHTLTTEDRVNDYISNPEFKFNTSLFSPVLLIFVWGEDVGTGHVGIAYYVKCAKDSLEIKFPNVKFSDKPDMIFGFDSMLKLDR